MSAGAAAAAFGGEHEALGGDDAEPTAAADAFELNLFISFHIPNAVVKISKKHAVIAGGHVAAFDSIGQNRFHIPAGAKGVSLVVGVNNFLHDQWMLYQAAVVG